jgi:hypothetical protein
MCDLIIVHASGPVETNKSSSTSTIVMPSRATLVNNLTAE